MICSSRTWTSLQAPVVADSSSRHFPTQPRRNEFTGSPASSNVHIALTASSSHRTRLHISLFSLTGLPDHQICAACEAATELRSESFEMSFDRTASFRGGAGSRPFVLIGERGLRRLQSFRQMLAAAMAQRGLRRLANTNFTPHVTLLYDARSVDEYPVEPVVWSVTEFVLVYSLKGHRHLARWCLQS